MVLVPQGAILSAGLPGLQAQVRRKRPVGLLTCPYEKLDR